MSNASAKSKSFFSRLSDTYKQLSAKSLSLATSPSVIGDLPALETDALTFYVLDAYSRANSMLLENELQARQLPSALNATHAHDIDETSALIFLKHRHVKDSTHAPKLLRLIEVQLANPDLRIRLVPVTVLWGRAPEKEDSIFKLLMNDEWRMPSIGKQLFNIGVMGRDSFVQLSDAKDLSYLISDAQYDLAAAGENTEDVLKLTQKIQQRLQGYLHRQRTSILGPDLSDRRNISDNILTSPQVQDAIMARVENDNKQLRDVKKEARNYVDEIASDYSYSVVRVFDRFLTRLWTQLYDGVEVRHFERVRALAPDHQIIYVPCHRSHMDYLLLSYVIYMRGLRVPHVAAGANLNIPILGEILRSGGAFFMRRSFKGNPLYSTVFKEYVHNLMQRSAPIEYFIEGGRSRSGRLLPPKLGMLAMTVNSYLRARAKPVVFIPTYISYERIMEGATYVGELKGKPKESENLLGLIKTARKIERIFGTVNLSFGEPLHLESFIKKFDVDVDLASAYIAAEYGNGEVDDAMLANQDKINAMIQNIGVKVMQHINRTAVVNPVSLIALVILSTPKSALDETHFLQQLGLYQQIAQLLPYDDDTDITSMAPDEMLAYGMKLKLVERTPHVLGDMVRVADKQAPMLSYFRNNILHIFIIPSLLAALVQRNGRISRRNLFEIGELLYPFLQAELFLKYAKRNIKDVLAQALQVLIDTGVVVAAADGSIMSPEGNSEGYQKLIVLASPAQQSLERYFMAVTLLAEQGDGRLTLEQTVDLCQLIGQRISILYADDLPDMFDKALFVSFIHALMRTGFITADDKQVLNFDNRLTRIAKHARWVLPPDTIEMLRHAASLSQAEIDEISEKKKSARSSRRS